MKNKQSKGKTVFIITVLLLINIFWIAFFGIADIHLSLFQSHSIKQLINDFANPYLLLFFIFYVFACVLTYRWTQKYKTINIAIIYFTTAIIALTLGMLCYPNIISFVWVLGGIIAAIAIKIVLNIKNITESKKEELGKIINPSLDYISFIMIITLGLTLFLFQFSHPSFGQDVFSNYIDETMSQINSTELQDAAIEQTAENIYKYQKNIFNAVYDTHKIYHLDKKSDIEVKQFSEYMEYLKKKLESLESKEEIINALKKQNTMSKTRQVLKNSPLAKEVGRNMWLILTLLFASILSVVNILILKPIANILIMIINKFV